MLFKDDSGSDSDEKAERKPRDLNKKKCKMCSRIVTNKQLFSI